MNTCPVCGHIQENDSALFCRNCGASLSAPEAAAPAAETSYAGAYPSPEAAPEPALSIRSSEAAEKLFYSNDERLIYVLDDKYYSSYNRTDNAIKKGAFLAVSSKRVYARGDLRETINGNGTGYKVKKNATVDLCDVTGVNVGFRRNVALLIFALIFLFGCISIMIEGFTASSSVRNTDTSSLTFLMIFFAVIAILLLIAYALTMQKIIVINYSGGWISFDAKKFTMSEIEDFQKALFLAKDKANEERYLNTKKR